MSCVPSKSEYMSFNKKLPKYCFACVSYFLYVSASAWFNDLPALRYVGIQSAQFRPNSVLERTLLHCTCVMKLVCTRRSSISFSCSVRTVLKEDERGLICCTIEADKFIHLSWRSKGNEPYCLDSFHSCTVHHDTSKVFYLPTDAQ
jgi:hypothetical protein